MRVLLDTGYTIVLVALVLLGLGWAHALELTGEDSYTHLLSNAELILHEVECVGLVKGFNLNGLDNLVSVRVHRIILP